MEAPHVMSVADFRRTLARAFEELKAPGAPPLFVGAWRKPEVVVMSVHDYEELVTAAGRRRSMDSAIGSVRAEGLEPTADGRAVLDRVAAGTMSHEDAIEVLLRRHRGDR